MLQHRLSSLTGRIDAEVDRKDAAAKAISDTMSEFQKLLSEEDYYDMYVIEGLVDALCKNTKVKEKVMELYAAFFEEVIPFFPGCSLPYFLTFFFTLFDDLFDPPFFCSVVRSLRPMS